MVQFTKIAAPHPFMLVSKINGHSPAKPSTRFCESYFVEVSHYIRFLIGACIA